VFSSREKAVDFAIRTLGSPPHENESWDGVELPAPDLIQFLLGDNSVRYIAVDPPPSGDVELVPTPEFVEQLRLEAGDIDHPREDFRRSLVRSLIYGDVN
jgi:hypothetical protein